MFCELSALVGVLMSAKNVQMFQRNTWGMRKHWAYLAVAWAALAVLATAVSLRLL